ncbi:hypothetical protein [Streptomyces sp. NPDC058671]|uniref:hypothetical protein n=1 Tax=Streptomyces sp. NPDC058671 TaxID=3346590 RepID=UPI00366885C9
MMAVACVVSVALGGRLLERSDAQRQEVSNPAGMGAQEGDFTLFEPTWTTAHIHQKGVLGGHDTGLVVTYAGPLGRHPGGEGDWVGIYEKGQLSKDQRKDWDWVCPNEQERCMSFGSAIIPAGDDGLESGKTYTAAYWTGSASESGRSPAVTIDFVVPW